MGKAVIQALGRIVWMAMVGSVGMAAAGTVIGALSGAAYALIFIPQDQAIGRLFMGAIVGIYCAVPTGACTGLVAFVIVGALSITSPHWFVVFEAAFRGGRRGAAVGTFAGGAALYINALAWNNAVWRYMVSQQHPLNELFRDAAIACFWGIIGGFAAGGLVGSVRAAQRALTKPKPRPEPWRATLAPAPLGN